MTDLIDEGGRVAGVRATTPDGDRSRSAPISSSAPTGAIRRCASAPGCACDDFGAPIDVLWMRVSQAARRSAGARSGASTPARMLVTLDRGDYWQCAYVIPKGGFDAVRARGLEALRDDVAAIAPFLRRPRRRAPSWDDVKLLDRRRSTGCGAGTGRACCASATPRTRCRRSAASASTSPCRTPSPPRTCSPRRCAPAR